MTYEPLLIMTANAGQQPDIKIAQAAHKTMALVGQEWSDEDDLHQRLIHEGMQALRPDVPGGKATPIYWWPKYFECEAFDSIELLPVVPGVTEKVKRLNVAELRMKSTDRIIRLGSIHNPDNQGSDERARTAARTMEERAAKYYDQFNRGVNIIGGDWNTTQDNVEAFRKRRWRSDQLIDPITTHGKNWKPDGMNWLYRETEDETPIIRWRGHETFKTSTNPHAHQLLLNRWLILVR